MHYYECIQELCLTKGISISKLCANIGLSNATPTQWKKGAIPTNQSLNKIAIYFDMTTEELINHLKAINIMKQAEDMTANMKFNTPDQKYITAGRKLLQGFACAQDNIKTAICSLLEIDIDINDIKPPEYK